MKMLLILAVYVLRCAHFVCMHLPHMSMLREHFCTIKCHLTPPTNCLCQSRQDYGTYTCSPCLPCWHCYLQDNAYVQPRATSGTCAYVYIHIPLCMSLILPPLNWDDCTCTCVYIIRHVLWTGAEAMHLYICGVLPLLCCSDVRITGCIWNDVPNVIAHTGCSSPWHYAILRLLANITFNTHTTHESSHRPRLKSRWPNAQ